MPSSVDTILDQSAAALSTAASHNQYWSQTEGRLATMSIWQSGFYWLFGDLLGWKETRIQHCASEIFNAIDSTAHNQSIQALREKRLVKEWLSEERAGDSWSVLLGLATDQTKTAHSDAFDIEFGDFRPKNRHQARLPDFTPAPTTSSVPSLQRQCARVKLLDFSDLEIKSGKNVMLPEHLLQPLLLTKAVLEEQLRSPQEEHLLLLARKVHPIQNPVLYEAVRERISQFPEFTHIQDAYDDLISTQTYYLKATTTDEKKRSRETLKFQQGCYKDRITACFHRFRRQSTMYKAVVDHLGDERYSLLPILNLSHKFPQSGDPYFQHPEYLYHIRSTELMAPIMRGKDHLGTPFVIMQCDNAQCFTVSSKHFSKRSWGDPWTDLSYFERAAFSDLYKDKDVRNRATLTFISRKIDSFLPRH